MGGELELEVQKGEIPLTVFDTCAAQIHRETLVGKASSSWKGWVHQPRLSRDTNTSSIQTLVGG